MRYWLWVISNEQWRNELLTKKHEKLSNFCLFLLTSWDFTVTDWCGGNLFTLNQTCWHLSVKKKHYLSSRKNIGMTFTNISSCQQVRFLTNWEPLKYYVLWIEWEILLLQVCFFLSVYLSALISKISWVFPLLPSLMCVILLLNNRRQKFLVHLADRWKRWSFTQN